MQTKIKRDLGKGGEEEIEKDLDEEKSFKESEIFFGSLVKEIAASAYKLPHDNSSLRNFRVVQTFYRLNPPLD